VIVVPGRHRLGRCGGRLVRNFALGTQFKSQLASPALQCLDQSGPGDRLVLFLRLLNIRQPEFQRIPIAKYNASRPSKRRALCFRPWLTGFFSGKGGKSRSSFMTPRCLAIRQGRDTLPFVRASLGRLLAGTGFMPLKLLLLRCLLVPMSRHSHLQLGKEG
jgi:hypothetical protein